ncbi:hypothetical protein [Mycobacterium uberis]|uniref:hypothetical protein n=1 Tax=Mycobacterium uberis TaxID=2162698 RepID=UPI001FB55DB7|nr:hypothetical protein [Mycobacterium uberis]
MSRGNDNFSAFALLVALAEWLRDRLVHSVRIVLVSFGAEEQWQGGIYGFMARHESELDHDQMYFLNCEAIGLPELIMLEGKGTTIMEDYYH